jgi:hypothetical protein
VRPPPIKGSAGEMRASAAKRLKKSSSGPNMMDGRIMVVEGCAANTSCSALAFERP